MKNKSKLIRKQLDNTFKNSNELRKISRPHKGWIKAIREALNMSTRQLGERMGVTQQRITSIEKDELNNSLTIETLQRVANATNTQFVYAFIPEESLEKIMKKQSQKFINAQNKRTVHSMGLENQYPTKQSYKDLVEIKAEELLNEHPSKIWDIPE